MAIDKRVAKMILRDHECDCEDCIDARAFLVELERLLDERLHCEIPQK